MRLQGNEWWEKVTYAVTGMGRGEGGSRERGIILNVLIVSTNVTITPGRNVNANRVFDRGELQGVATHATTGSLGSGSDTLGKLEITGGRKHDARCH